MSTRLSLYRLFLGATQYVEVSFGEYSRIMAWMANNKSRTTRRNAVDNLYETFVWFPAFQSDRCFVPLGHSTRLLKQVEQRIGARATHDHPNVVFQLWLGDFRPALNGSQVLEIKLRQIREIIGHE